MKRLPQQGFGSIMVILIVVVLAAFAAAVVKFGTVQASTSAQDISSARAWQAAKAGTEWGLYQAIRPGETWHTVAGCNAASGTPVNISGANLGFTVSVRCQAVDYNEGEALVSGGLVPQVVRHFVITATACNGGNACPDAAAAVTPSYVERVRQVSAVCTLLPGATTC